MLNPYCSGPYPIASQYQHKASIFSVTKAEVKFVYDLFINFKSALPAGAHGWYFVVWSVISAYLAARYMYMYVCTCTCKLHIIHNFVPAACSQDYVGTSFSLAFPSGLSASAFLRLYIATDSESYVLVTADVPNQSERRLSQGYVRCRTPQVSLSRPLRRPLQPQTNPRPVSSPTLIHVRRASPYPTVFR